MKTLLLSVVLTPLFASAGNLSAILTNPDVVLINDKINYVGHMEDYNFDKPEFSKTGGKVHKVWSKDKGGYFMSAEFANSSATKVTEISRQTADNNYLVRKAQLGSDESIKVLTECNSTNGLGFNDLVCVTVTENLCKQIHAVYPDSNALVKDLVACDKLTANLKKMETIYTKETATKAHKEIFDAEVGAIKSDFADLTNTFKLSTSVNKTQYKLSESAVSDMKSAGKTFSTLAKLCNTQQAANKPSWVSAKARPSETRNTSEQNGQR